MYKNITIALVLAASSGLIWADEPYDQLTNQIQKVETRVDTLEKNAKQSQDAVLGFNVQVQKVETRVGEIEKITKQGQNAMLGFKIQAQKVKRRVDALEVQAKNVKKLVDALEKTTKQSQDTMLDLKKQTGELAASGEAQQKKLEEMSAMILALESKQTALGGGVEQLSRDTKQKTQSIDETITTRTKWYGAAITVLLLLLAGCYWYLRRRNDASEQTFSAQVKSAMDSVRSTEEKIAKSDSALADSLFEILNKLKVQEMIVAANGHSKPAEVDHHLPMKLADEIHRMRKRLASLPEDTKGLKPLQKSIERLESELAEQGYEIVDHTGMAYTENLSVKARFVPSDDLRPEQKIIRKVVVPQVNYKDVMIRMADIEVSIGS